MGLTAGTKLGTYEITTLIAAGGMGEVYRARDGKLGRDVALKVLPNAFARDPERVARFECEARLLAALNHPHIAAIYGLEESGPTVALVMELVEGPTLAELIDKGVQPAQALLIARQIAEALEYAHDRNVIHRDLKPANIKVRADGSVKVLDFGLAKVLSEDSTSEDARNLPTLNAISTEAGRILGTAAYMSPEQARGQAVDKRTDIWAFGAVLYEMLTGKMAFPGATLSDMIAAVLEREPDWTALPPSVPAPLERLLQRCLEKDGRRRMRDSADVRIELEDVLHPRFLRTESASDSSPGRPRMNRLLVALAVSAAILAGLAIGNYLRRTPTPESVARLSLSAPGTVQEQIAPAVSPDGRRVAFVSTNSGSRPMLWVRDLDSLEPHVLAGTEDSAHPFWSPDGRFIGFVADGKLSRVDLADGSVLMLTDQSVARSEAAWSRTGVVLFRLKTGAWATVPAGGGQVTPLTIANNGAWPHFLPDGTHFLFLGRAPQGSAVYIASLESSQATMLMPSTYEAAYAAPGYLLFFRAGSLMAQPFDATTMQLSGNAEPVAKGVWSVAASNHASWSVSDTGVLAYTNDSLRDTELVWFDRRGQALGSVGPDLLQNEIPQISPDGKHIAIARDRGADEDIWLFDQPGAPPLRLTLSHGFVHAPVWLSNSRIAFQSISPSQRKMVAKDVAPVGPGTVLADLPPGALLYDVSERYAICSMNAANGVRDLWVLPLGGGQPTLFAHSASANNVQAQISPNGKWAAYTSYESGRDEVYVASFPTPSIKRQISTNGGVQPRWRRNGSELFYVATDQSMMAVPVLNPETLQTGTPSALFRTRLIAQGSLTQVFDTLYDVNPDGQKFLMNVAPANMGPPYTVVLNWTAGLKR